MIPCQFAVAWKLAGANRPSLVTTYLADQWDNSRYFPDFGCSLRFAGRRDGRATRSLRKIHGTNKWGYIDKSGEWAIEPEYEEARVFSDGLGLVYSADKGAGFVNAQGQLVVERLHGRHVVQRRRGVCFRASSDDDDKAASSTTIRYAAIDKSGAWTLDSAKSVYRNRSLLL